MAIAGRVLLMPKGAYDASVTYEMLDMVSYDGVTWVAKKTCAGIVPSADTSEYWFAMVGVSSDDFETFKNEVLDSVEASISEAISESEEATESKINAVDSRVTTVNNSLSKYVPLAGGNMTGTLKAVNPSLNVEGVRNITAGTTDLTAGTSALATGSIYIVYE